ncbi:dephospho-CoA kinase [Jeotgalibacillus campisalis]|uniref:Dephospho-CoA kinase n=1 Tax=Jeotgalibacillus campisalis TaxID=220754 RepID=A0A0C2VBG6_9BACL|nr:dephospho-CoA kinase [Jeotgalibacillus campisalis]KIL46292.1 dephospho-CoA kinase [Jeotgalibacillus campisalis]
MIIGLTGGIASGKSTIANWLIEREYAVIDADLAARKVVEPNQEAYRKIVEQFGKRIVAEDGTIDRAQLGAIIFGSKTEREKLNSIVHPAVRKEMLEQKQKAVHLGKQTIFLDIPLLFESKLQWMVDKIVVVYVQEDIQLKRLMERNQYSAEEAQARISSQLPLREKKAQADAVIDNSGTVEQSFIQMEELLVQWKAAP